ncbi:MAG: hypothetical protein GY854_14295 [Deltaproteobacteria bacterium]|nr:hypothetical protein [Deltaproteobacteria bacterium]
MIPASLENRINVVYSHDCKTKKQGIINMSDSKSIQASDDCEIMWAFRGVEQHISKNFLLSNIDTKRIWQEDRIKLELERTPRAVKFYSQDFLIASTGAYDSVSEKLYFADDRYSNYLFAFGNDLKMKNEPTKINCGSINCICVFRRELFVFDYEDNSILRFNLEKDTSNIKEPDQRFHISSVLDASPNSRLSVWQYTKRGQSIFEFLIWEPDSQRCWLARHNIETDRNRTELSFIPADFGMPSNLSALFRLSHVCVDDESDQLFISDSGNHIVYQYPYLDSRKSKAILGMGGPGLSFLKPVQSKITNPKGLVYYRLMKGAFDSGIVLAEDSSLKKRDTVNEFLVVINDDPHVAVTMFPNTIKSNVRPLVGELDSSVKGNTSGIITELFGNSTEVFALKDGSLLFGEYGTREWYKLQLPKRIETSNSDLKRGTKLDYFT